MSHPILRAALVAAGGFLLHGPAHAASVLMVSVDGMKPEYVLEADAHGLKIPFLRGLLREGSFARGVTGVLPTVTYPSHTTLITGVSPAEHGILNNQEFDPRRTYGESWYWYAARIRVPTLWQAARAAGLSTASIGWPASVEAPVDTLIPEYWRINRPTPELPPSDRALIGALSRPADLLARLEPRLGPYMAGNDPSPAGDVIKTRYAVDIIRSARPRFMTVHLSALDEEEHAHGPFSAEANQELEVLDGALAEMSAAMRANDAGAAVVVVSDHGFLPLATRVNLFPAFAEAGLLQFSVDARRQVHVASWKATLWSAGGTGAVMLNPDAPADTRAAVRALLDRLQADARYGIAEVLDADRVKERGGFPGAAFLLVMRPGSTLIADAAADPVAPVPVPGGGHGFSPDLPEMRAAFFAAGRDIARQRDLGQIDMRQIAPSVAQLLGVELPSARAPRLRLRP